MRRGRAPTSGRGGRAPAYRPRTIVVLGVFLCGFVAGCSGGFSEPRVAAAGGGVARPGSAAAGPLVTVRGSSVGDSLSAARRDPSSAATDRPRPRTAPLVDVRAAQHRPLPDESGKGRRVVYSVSRQRTWLVAQDGQVKSTYLVSGQREQPGPGRYEVYSKSRHATSSVSAETMEFMVRFTYGRYTGAPIGFHSIPVGYDGEPVQSAGQLGKPLSAGCIRQRHSDARDLWDFTTIGTPVVVTP